MSPGLLTEEPGVFSCSVALRVRSKKFWSKWSPRRLSVVPVLGQKCCRFVLKKVDGSKREEHIVFSQTHTVRPIEENSSLGTGVYVVFDIRESKRSVLAIGMDARTQRSDIQRLVGMLQEMEIDSTVKWGLEEDES